MERRMFNRKLVRLRREFLGTLVGSVIALIMILGSSVPFVIISSGIYGDGLNLPRYCCSASDGCRSTDSEMNNVSLISSSFLGGDDEDFGFKIKKDEEGNYYVAGCTRLSNFPRPSDGKGWYHPGQKEDIFVTKFSSDIRSILATTLIGGSDRDYVLDMQIAADGRLLLTGETGSPDFPTTSDSFQSELRGPTDAILVIIDTATLEPIYSSYYGGSDNETALSITTAIDGRIFIAGGTESPDLPISGNSIQGIYGGATDGFLAIFNRNGTSLEFSTYYGGSNYDWINDILDYPDDEVILYGGTRSIDFHTTENALQHDCEGDCDLFIGIFNITNGVLEYSSYIGGELDDVPSSIARLSTGEIIFSGSTASQKFLNTTRGNGSNESEDIFIFNLDMNTNNIGFMRFILTNANDNVYDMVIDKDDEIIICGYVLSTDFPTTPDAIKKVADSSDGFVMRLSENGSEILYSTLLGGSASDDCTGIVIGEKKNVIVTGFTYSADFPVTPDGYQPLFGYGRVDAFLSIIKTYVDRIPPIADAGPDQVVDQYQMVHLDASNSYDSIGIINYTWTYYYGSSKKALYDVETSLTISDPGTYLIELNVSDEEGNWATDTMQLTVRDIDPPMAVAGPDVSLDQHETLFLDGSRSSDNVGVVNWTWRFMYNDSTILLYGKNVSFRFDLAGIVNIELNVSDAAGNQAIDVLVLTINDTTPPKADAGPDVIVGQHEPAQFDASASSDNVGIVNWTWEFAVNGTLNRLYGELVQFTFDDVGQYVATLTAKDARENAANDTLTVTVRDTTSPIADCGDDISVDVNDRAMLDGSGSRDNVGIVGYSWNFSYGGKHVVLEGAKVDYEFKIPGQYRITLTVFDAEDNRAQDELIISVSNSQVTQSVHYLWLIVLIMIIVIVGLISWFIWNKTRD